MADVNVYGASENFAIRNEVRTLTAFRFFAAFYVFLFHVESRAPIFGDGLASDFIHEGAVGMSMFFVLSGFILGYAYDGLKIDLRQFFWNRFARIYPIYALAAILALPWLIVDLGDAAEGTSAVFALLAGVILLSFGVLLLQAWLPQAFSFWNNNASWSISNEAFFYSLFPYLRDVLSSFGGGRRLIILFGALCVLSSMVPAASIVFNNAPDSFPLYYALPLFRLPEFICGIIAWQLSKFGPPSRVQLIGMLAVISAGFAHVAFLGALLPGFTLHNWIVIPAISATLILLHTAEVRGGGKWFANSVLVWLGKISYCFYSFQFHVLEGLRLLTPPNLIGNATYLLLSFVALLAVSAIAHHMVEEPARIWLRNRMSRRGQVV